MTFAFSNNGAASVEATRRAVNAALLSTGYSCKTVSWDDVSRGTVFGTLSSLGANITDTYLKARDGTKLFTVRSDNWNEKLGVVRAEDIALLIGNCDRSDTLQNITLEQFLSNPAALGASYTGIQRHVRLADTDPNKMVSIRFQTVFLPVSADASGRGRMQFAAEAYNYATRSDQDPRNLILLATTQGLSVQADGAGAKRLLLHAGLPPFVNEYWLEAESSAHSVGGEQRESAAEREDALRRGKATSEVIGIKAMGTRFNVLMTIQIPLVQSQQSSLFGGTSPFGGSGFGAQPSSVFGGFGASTFGSKPGSGLFGASQAQPQNTFSFGKSTSGANGVFGPGYGQSSASVGSSFGSGSVASPSANAASSTPFGAPAVGFGGSVSPSKDPGSTFSAGASTQLTPQADGAPNGGALGSSGSTTASPVSAPAVPAAVFGASPVVPSAVTFGASPATAVVVDKKDPSSVFGPAAAAARLRAQGLVHLSSAQGRASAARVSRGEFYARYTGLTVKEPRRNDAEHITVTCVLYNTVVGGIPNEADVLAAVADMDKLYAACTASGRLADAAFSFMTPELSSFDVVKINAKSWNMPPVMHQPPGANRGPNIVSTMQHPHTFANASGSARDIVMAKYSQLEFTPFLTANAMLELKLLTFGALQADSMRVVLGSKFDEIAFRINSGDAFGAKALLPELKLLIQGSLSLQ